MAKYFTDKELMHSSTAVAKGISNIAAGDDLRRLRYLMEHCLDPIRELYGEPIIVTSGYRSRALNAAVGGTPNSQHMRGEAADIMTGSREGNKRLFELIRKSTVPYDQLINERPNINGEPGWIHISCKESGNRRQVVTIY